MPQRTCIACRQRRGKREMLRIVRTAGGDLEVDTTGKQPGRGAYLCRNRECWTAAIKGKRLGAALRSEVTRAELERVLEEAQYLLEGATP